jgi:CRP/FNR family transcriptional regulator, cyclic AMP receptor protein
MASRRTAKASDSAPADPAFQRWAEGEARPRDWVAVLVNVPMFSDLGKRQLRRIAGLAQVVEFAPGEFVVQQGERGDAFYLILAGSARVLGKGGSRRVFRPGDFFGEMALLDGQPRSASVTAASELQAMRIPHRPFLKMLEGEPRIAVAMLRELAARIRTLQRQAAV